MTTGERIRYYRKLNNMTMVELAQKIGVQHSAIYKYETGKVTNIPIGNINKMAYVFNIPASSHIKMPQADRTWGAAGGGIPPIPGGEGAKRPETLLHYK